MPARPASVVRTALILAGLWTAVWPSVGKLRAAAPKRPNFVFFLVDDLGWADVGCFGSTFHKTPHIDALAASGMKFTNGYAACPVCSPTRASIMTGRHPVRVDITDWIPGMSASRAPNAKFLQVVDRDNLALEEVTIAEVLQRNDYQTFFAGKWHLGGQGFWPTDQGLRHQHWRLRQRLAAGRLLRAVEEPQPASQAEGRIPHRAAHGRIAEVSRIAPRAAAVLVVPLVLQCACADHAVSQAVRRVSENGRRAVQGPHAGRRRTRGQVAPAAR